MMNNLKGLASWSLALMILPVIAFGIGSGFYDLRCTYPITEFQKDLSEVTRRNLNLNLKTKGDTTNDSLKHLKKSTAIQPPESLLDRDPCDLSYRQWKKYQDLRSENGRPVTYSEIRDRYVCRKKKGLL